MMLSGLTGLEVRCDAQCTKCISKQYDALADRIEREHIPYQRDQEGKPWRIGDPCIYHDKAAVIRGFGDGDSVNIMDTYECDPPLYIWVNNGELSRPAPKVLDADDMEIKVRDVVYKLSDGTKWRVEDIHTKEPRITVKQLNTDKDVCGGWFLANEYTHV